MKYAIISDIHGNNHAFDAVITDAKAQNVDMYLLLGDYLGGSAHGNDVATTMRKLSPAIPIRGNGEGYLVNLQKQDPQTMTHQQFKPMYWSYRTLDPENLAYLINLPETAAIKGGDFDIHLEHAMSIFFRNPKVRHFHSCQFRIMMEKEPFIHEEYLIRARKELLARPEAVSEIMALPKGIYLFGHNHMAFHMEYEGRVFINPGSCGEPLNWDTRAQYTILTINGPDWAVTERRVEYDLQRVIDGLTTSGFSAYAPEWSEVMKLQLSGKDHVQFFVNHIKRTGWEMGKPNEPVSNDVWEAAIKTWDPVKCLHL